MNAMTPEDITTQNADRRSLKSIILHYKIIKTYLILYVNSSVMERPLCIVMDFPQ